MNFGLFEALVTKIDFGSITLAILAVFAMLIVVEIAKKGSRLLVDMIWASKELDRHYKKYDDVLSSNKIRDMKRWDMAHNRPTRTYLYTRRKDGKAIYRNNKYDTSI